MASSRRKQDEKHLKILRDLGSQAANRTCFDCHQRGTTYINMTVGSFVCTSCSGILRGLNPPHRVKSISMASFTPEEIEQIKSKGNQYCQAVWLGLYDAKANPFPDTKDEHKIRDFMILKYEKKRFHVEPSIALKNMPPQTSSANSSNASTPSSETSNKVAGGGGIGAGGLSSSSSSSLAAAAAVSTTTATTGGGGGGGGQVGGGGGGALSAGGPTANVSVSRPNTSSSQSAAASASAKNSTAKSSALFCLLADLDGGQAGSSSVNANDPFASPTSAQAPASISQPSFANFENANIFTNTAGSTTSNKSTPSGPPPFSNNPLTPMTPGSSSALPTSSSSASSATTALSNNPTQDRYAALKDLDEEFKTQKESETASGGGSWPVPNGNHQNSPNVFGTSSSSMNGGGTLFGSPGSSSASVFGTGLVNGGGGAGGGTGGVFGTPPTNNGSSWANFSGANPFSAAAGNSSSGGGGGGGWMNGGGSFGTTPQTQQGFGSVVQPSLFGTTPDPNFNQFSPSGPMNGTAAAATTNNGAWASFSQQPPPQQQPNPKMQWMTSNGAANPFMAAPQLPSNGTSYNPFL
ncbi:arf-GAP domain and FG repeat-containing protein 1-like isoform X2 [Penaeus japonicus]|uniref:arf-GAP domain and FG repeat-containing protein 1-like isoform X2 n=1 Tax=Penaeus japonicus TaxID=27405 RepID=UPI001C711E53|nr:arf-GAP domain and FG repeat-containing protein 1-like isoform X2 [Penaeus japonicus]